MRGLAMRLGSVLVNDYADAPYRHDLPMGQPSGHATGSRPMTAQICASALTKATARERFSFFRAQNISKNTVALRKCHSVRLERCILAAGRYSERPEHDPMQGYVDHFAQYQQDIDALIDYAKSTICPNPRTSSIFNGGMH